METRLINKNLGIFFFLLISACGGGGSSGETDTADVDGAVTQVCEIGTATLGDCKL